MKKKNKPQSKALKGRNMIARGEAPGTVDDRKNPSAAAPRELGTGARIMTTPPIFFGGQEIKFAYLNSIQTSTLTLYTRTRQEARSLPIGQPITVNGEARQITRRPAISKNPAQRGPQNGKMESHRGNYLPSFLISCHPNKTPACACRPQERCPQKSQGNECQRNINPHPPIPLTHIPLTDLWLACLYASALKIKLADTWISGLV